MDPKSAKLEIILAYLESISIEMDKLAKLHQDQSEKVCKFVAQQIKALHKKFQTERLLLHIQDNCHTLNNQVQFHINNSLHGPLSQCIQHTSQAQFQLVIEDLSDAVSTIQNELLVDYKYQVKEVERACTALENSNLLQVDYSALVFLLNSCMAHHFEDKVGSLVRQLQFLINMC